MLPPPVVLTFLAPARQCNQRCPNCYITEVRNEPVREFDLTPQDYAAFVQQFVDAEIPILSVKFQGYEVTLPRSWPYLERVFRVVQPLGVRRSFITNGMLLHKWSHRIQELDVHRITVSLDGASAAANDDSRGLAGAFKATTRSLKLFISEAPNFRSRLAVTSLLRGDSNFESLLAMPELLLDLGVSRWIVGPELGEVNGEFRPLLSTEYLLRRLPLLQAEAERVGIGFFASDEYGSLPRNARLTVRGIRAREFFYRMDPTGAIHIGRDIFRSCDRGRAPRWRPNESDAVDLVGYWRQAERLTRIEPSEGRR